MAAVQAVYQFKSQKQSVADVIREYKDYRLGTDCEGEAMVMPDPSLFEDVVNHTVDNMKVVQGHMKSFLAKKEGLSVDRLLEAVMLCGISELLYHKDTDGPIIISDYMHVTDAFYDGREKALVNAVLDAAFKELR